MSHSPLPSRLKSIFSQVVLYGMLSANTYAQVTFTADTTSGCAPLTVNFTNTSTPPANYFRWDFGDGDTLWALNALHTYDSSGTFQAILQGWDTTGGGMNFSGADTLVINIFSVPVVDSVSKTDASCNGQCDGTATVSVTGIAPFTFLWNTGCVSATCTGLCAGTYSVTVNDANGCTATSSVTINQPSLLSVTLTKTDATCNGYCNGSATANVSGGTSPYTYQWSNGWTTTNITGQCAGNYTFSVTDNNGCTATSSVTITQPSALTITLTKTNETCNGTCDGSADAVVSGGLSPYTYLWNDPSTQTYIPATGLCSGVYILTVTDANGCTGTSSVTITGPIISLTTGTVNANCTDSSGQVSVTSSGGVVPYTYNWSSGCTASVCDSLPAGTYTVTVTDSCSGTKTATATINATGGSTAATSISASANPICSGSSTTLSVSGGSLGTGAIWEWYSGSCGGTLVDSGAAIVVTPVANTNYYVRAEGTCNTTTCKTLTINVNNAPGTPGAVSGQTNICTGQLYTYSISTVTGATSYTWTFPAGWVIDNGQGTTSISAIPGSSGNICVVASNSCGNSAFSCLSVNVFSVSISMTNVSCNGGNNGSLAAIASWGTPPYTYSWSTGSTTSTITGLSAGTFTVTVTSNNGCISTASSTVSQPTALTVSIGGTDATCATNCNGSASPAVTGGTPPYTYLWNTGDTQSTETGLCSGSYSVTVSDSKGCSASSSVNITEPSAITIGINITPSTCSICDGSATANPSNGTPPYTYQWDDPLAQTTSMATGLCSGTYTLTMSDALGCSLDTTVSVGNTGGFTVAVFSQNLLCNGDSSGSASASPSGGTQPYTYLWSNGQTDSTATGLSAGNYIVTVYDSTGCSFTGNISITQPQVISITLSTTQPDCYGSSNGSATAIASGGTPLYTYLWNNAQITSIASGLIAGIYTVTVNDANACSVTSYDTVSQPDQIIISITSTDATCATNCNGNATPVVSGGTPPFTYSWSNSFTTSAAQGLCGGTYTLTVYDNKGCTGTASVTLTAPPGINLTTNSAPSACSSPTGSATVTAAGGAPPYTYLWSNAAITDSIFNLTAGNYTVTVNDSAGCSASSQVTVTFANMPSVTITSVLNASCTNVCNGNAIANISGGTPPLAYLWTQSGETTATAIALCTGINTFQVTDSNGCSASQNVTILPSYSISLTTGSTQALCAAANGSATVTASGGVAPYTYLWNTGGTNSILNNIPSGSYSVQVTDSNGCTANAFLSVSANTAGNLTFYLSATHNICNNVNSGSSTVHIMSGSFPYTYLWSTSQTTQTISDLTNGWYTVTVTDANGCTKAKQVWIGTTFNNTCKNIIKGKVWADTSGNCIMENNEWALSSWQVIAIKNNTANGGSTNYNGDYLIMVDTGIYVVYEIVKPFWQQDCPSSPGTYTVNFSTVGNTISNLDFGNEIIDWCAQMNLSISSTNLRPCFSGTYWIYYKNNGTIPANNVSIEVTFDSEISPVSSNPPWTSQNGNTYTFNIGTVNPFLNAGYIRVDVNVSCSAILGSTQCITAHIYPDSLCTPPNLTWDKSSIKVTGECVNGQACFTIKNKGQSMTGPSQYRIYSNNTKVYTGTFQLNSGDSLVVCWPTNGKTIRLEADQRPGHPGNSHPQAAVELCGNPPYTNPPYTFGQITQVYGNNSDPFEKTYCLVLTSSIDPNDKSVNPEGIPPGNYIDTAATLSYHINFQNTGTDTAFNIVIYDTLSPYLDVTTVEDGSSSHPHSFRVLGEGVLEWTFADIQLPDSNVDEPGSHGFVEYSVKQLLGTPYWATIDNRAGIIFDFNNPVMTNTVTNTVINLDSITSIAPVNFTADASTGCGSLNVNFTNTSIASANYFRWSFGDGDTLWAANASHLYDTFGYYEAYLEGWDTSGGGMSYIGICGMTISVYPAPTIIASVTDATSPANNDGAIDITVTGGIGAYTYLWSTSDVTEDLTGLSAGTYTVTVTDANSCEAVYTDTVELIIGELYHSPSATHQLLIYPNPNTGSFVVEITPTKYEFVRTYEVRIMNILGEMVYGKVFSDSYIRKFVTNSLFVDLDLPDGIYALRVEADGEAVGMTRIIIER